MLYAVIMAGGKGTRFWPKSRQSKPKQLLNITGSQTILQTTVERIKPIVPVENIIIVAAKEHEKLIQQQLPELLPKNIILEPQGKNTAACIALAAFHLKHRDPEAIMLTMPADHIISELEKYYQILQVCIEASKQQDLLLTIGIKPTRAETGYGYIDFAEELFKVKGQTVFKVHKFREKPDLKTAQEYFKSGHHFWNSGMFVWKVETILNAFEEFLPNHYMLLKDPDIYPIVNKNKEILASAYEKLDAISIDYGILEKASNTAAVKADFAWHDVGSWEGLYDILPQDEFKNASLGSILTANAEGNLVSMEGKKLVVLLGVNNLVVVDTPDALLVCDKKRSQEVKEIVLRLERENRKDLL